MNLIILGASARAAAFSAHRAGMRPWCVDLFGDADLARAFPVRRVPLDGYPHALVDALADAPDGPVLYTGGLENYPDLIARIDRPLWGNPPDVLRRVRDPFVLAGTLRRHGMPVLDVRNAPPPPGETRYYLRKPLRGSGGIGVRPYVGPPLNPATHYLQEYDPGHCFGAVFLGMPGRGALLLGVSWLLALRFAPAPAFRYAGNLVPCAVPVANLQALGDVLVREFGLAGLFGVDTVFRRDASTGAGSHRVLEVNPRYTASVEVLEHVCGRAMLEMHRAIFERRPIVWSTPARWPAAAGKIIVYARRAIVFPAEGPWQQALRENPLRPSYADIPQAGELMRRSQPVLTVFGSGVTEGQCLQELRRKVETLDRHLYGG
jgi:uncharacterized protein